LSTNVHWEYGIPGCPMMDMYMRDAIGCPMRGTTFPPVHPVLFVPLVHEGSHPICTRNGTNGMGWTGGNAVPWDPSGNIVGQWNSPLYLTGT